MQHFYGRRGGNYFRSAADYVPKIILALCAVGCGERPSTIDIIPPKPFEGTVLTVAVANPADRELVRHLGRSWGARAGAVVRIADATWDGSTDIGLVAPADLSRWAAAGIIAEVPASFQDRTHGYRWDDQFTVYSTRLLRWNRRAYALPVVAEGMVLAYRKDAFDGKAGRPAGPPRTWEEYLAAAKAFGPESLPPVSENPEALAAEFFSAAASADRLAISRVAPGQDVGDDFFAFQFDPKTGEPRLRTPTFVGAAELLLRAQPYRGRAATPAAAFQSGRAKLGVLTLAELAAVRPATAAMLGIAPLPGSAYTFGPNGRKVPTLAGAVNFVPYLGWGGRVGVVAAGSPKADAAWDFLADAGDPDRAALDLIAAARFGAGPYRPSQIDTRARPRWYGYNLSATETDRLTAALRDNLGLGVQNPRLGVRTSNQHELAAALDAVLRSMLMEAPAGDPAPRAADAMEKADAAWREIIGRTPPAEWKAAVRAGLGL